jgi:hypothetical protein
MSARLRRAGFRHSVRDCSVIVRMSAASGFPDGSETSRLPSSPNASYMSSPSTGCWGDAASAWYRSVEVMPSGRRNVSASHCGGRRPYARNAASRDVCDSRERDVGAV